VVRVFGRGLVARRLDLGSAHRASPLTEGGDLLFMLGLALLGQNLVVARRYNRLQADGQWQRVLANTR